MLYNKSSNGPLDGANSNNHLISRKRIATFRRRVQGARQRVNRLEEELSATRSILRRRFVEIPLDSGAKEIKRLQPFEIATYRNQREEIEHELTIARRDYLINDREYKEMVFHNLKLNHNKVKKAKNENNIRRQTKSLLNKTMEILERERANGGAEKVQQLFDLAKSGDVKAFRSAFDEYGPGFNADHYVRVSGISDVKTEILHDLMDAMSSTSGIAVPVASVPVTLGETRPK